MKYWDAVFGWRLLHTALTLAVLLLAANMQHCTAQEDTAAAAALPAAAQQAQNSLQRMMQTPLYGPDWLLAEGIKGSLSSSRNWARLAARLSSPGANITVAAFGGSVTAGYKLKPNRMQSWAYQLVGWLREAFPSATVNFEHNFARDAVNIHLAATCW
jgi:hypothetical protein